MSKSKAKGTRWENGLRDKLNEVPGCDARRVVGSGMFAQGNEDSEFFGDVRAMTPIGEVIFEAKYRTKSAWKGLQDWLKGHDILVVREARCEPYVFMTWEMFAKVLKLREGESTDELVTEADLGEISRLIKDYFDRKNA